MLSIVLKYKYKLCFIIAFSFLVVFAIVFYFERLYSDAGYYFFLCTNFQTFHIEHGRYVLFFAEFLPVIGTYLGCSLKTLAILYSVNHVFFHFALALACWVLFKKINATFFIVLLQFIGIRESIFTPQFELYYGLSILVFAVAYFQYKIEQNSAFKILHSVFFLGLNFLVFSAHPMGIYCYFMVLFFYILKHKKYIKIAYYSIASLIFYIVWKRLFASEYESIKFNQFFSGIMQIFSSSFLNFEGLKKGFLLVGKTYPDVLLIFGLGIYFFIKNDKKIQLLVYILSFLFLLFTTWLLHHTDTITRYIEQVYFPWVFSCLIWLLFVKTNKYLEYFIGISIVFRVFIILIYAQRFSIRKQQMAEFAAQLQLQKQSKFYINRNQLNKIEDIANWSYSFETLMYFAMYYPKHITICLDEDIEFENNKLKLNTNTFIFRKWEIWQQQQLNSKFYQLDTGNYQFLNFKSKLDIP